MEFFFVLLKSVVTEYPYCGLFLIDIHIWIFVVHD